MMSSRQRQWFEREGLGPPLNPGAVSPFDTWFVINQTDKRVAESHFSEDTCRAKAQVLQEHAEAVGLGTRYEVRRIPQYPGVPL